ncbi:calcium-binding protein, partial [Terricaulis sp.]|uniref:calcium-binding protein n=1 Tax=Terricaulis sp. TaxID=2768686 RepID=UPI002AC6F49D
MPWFSAYEPFSFDPSSTLGDDNFLVLLADPGAYTVIENTSTVWTVELANGARVRFVPATGFSFTPGEGTAPPSGRVGTVYLYEGLPEDGLWVSIGGLSPRNLSVAQMIATPSLLVGGADTFEGGEGSDEFHAGDGNDVLWADYSFNGAAAGDALYGDAGADEIYGAGGADFLYGGDGDDQIVGYGGADTIDGGAGNDIIGYDISGGVVVNLTTGENPDGDILIDVESVSGTNDNDVLIGNAERNLLMGNGGDDILRGLDGDDYLVGGAGFDLLEGGAGADHHSASGFGNTATYENSPAGVQVDLLADPTPGDGIFGVAHGGDAEGDTFNNYFYNLIGSAFADDLLGNDADNVFWGGGGDDVLNGRNNDDVLDGGAGVDVSVYSVASNEAEWSRNIDGSYTVTTSTDGVDTLTTVEIMRFTDRDVVLDNAQQTFSGDGASDVLWRNTSGLIA